MDELFTYAELLQLIRSSICTICDNADRIKESAMSETKVCVAQLP
jgi:hypothetical protein